MDFRRKLQILCINLLFILTACSPKTTSAVNQEDTPISPTMIAATPVEVGALCNPGTILVPDALYENKELEVRNWIDWNHGIPIRLIVDETITFSYAWNEKTDIVSLQLDGSVIQTETIPQGTSASFALSATTPQGTTMLRSIVIAHCGENSWAYSEDGKGEIRNIPFSGGSG